MVIEETNNFQRSVHGGQVAVTDAVSSYFERGILGSALAQVRESGFGGLHYPHDQFCEKDHSSAATVVRKGED